MKSKWFGPRALGLHVALIAWLAMCAAAAWWQVGRAVQGNSLSFMYAIEWPVFGVLGVLGWFALLNMETVTAHKEAARREYEEKHARRGPGRPRGRQGRGGPGARRVQRPPGQPLDQDQEEALGPLMERAFQRYRLMSFVTGTTLLILCVFLVPAHRRPLAVEAT